MDNRGRNQHDYNEEGHRLITLPDWTKSINSGAVMRVRDVVQILGIKNTSDLYQMVKRGTFPDADVTLRGGFNLSSASRDGKTKGWSMKLLRSLEKK